MDFKGRTKKVGLWLGGVLFFFGIIITAQAINFEKIGTEQSLGEFLYEEFEPMYVEQCTADGISEAQCKVDFEEIFEAPTVGPLQSLSEKSTKYKPHAMILIAIGALLMIVSTGLNRNLAKVFGSRFVSLGLFTGGTYAVIKFILLPRVEGIESGGGFSIGAVLAKFITENILNYQLTLTIIFLATGVALTIAFYVMKKLATKEPPNVLYK